MWLTLNLYSFFLCNDFAGQALGAEPTLPYLSPELNGEALLVGANFASAGIGILNDTGIQFVSEILILVYFWIDIVILSNSRTGLIQTYIKYIHFNLIMTWSTMYYN